MSFYVFSLTTKEARQETGIVGFRDWKTFDTRDEAVARRKELKALPRLPVTDLPIRSHVVLKEKS